MRALLPTGPDVRDPMTAGRTYTVVAGLLAAVYVFLATAWQTDWSIGVVPAVIASSSVAAVVVWHWFVPADEKLSYGRAVACGALVGVLAHFFAGPL